MRLYSIPTGFFKLDGGAMFGVVPKVIWQKLQPPDDQNLCTWAMRCLLVETGNRLILIDTGIGRKQSEKFFSHYDLHGEDSLLSSIHAQGFQPKDITDVILTHLHFDHCGGAVERNSEGVLIPTFPKATYWSHSDHWSWATNPNPREKASFLSDNFLPLQESGQLQFINHHPWNVPEISFHLAYGHTEAQIIPIIQTSAGKLAYMADLIPSPAHIPIPYVMGYDVRPLLTMEEKSQFLRRAMDENITLFYEHDPTVECSTLIETDRGFKAGDFFPLHQFI